MDLQTVKSLVFQEMIQGFEDLSSFLEKNLGRARGNDVGSGSYRIGMIDDHFVSAKRHYLGVGDLHQSLKPHDIPRSELVKSDIKRLAEIVIDDKVVLKY